MATTEFKVCGFCTKLVCESVELSGPLRPFLAEFLGVANRDLPGRVCAECHRGAVNCRRFRDNYDKAAATLKNKRLSNTVILGRSVADLRQIEAAATAGGAKMAFGGYGKVAPVPGTSRAKIRNPKDAQVVISSVEIKLAEMAQNMGGTIDYRKRKGGLITPSRNSPTKKGRMDGVATTSVSSFGRVSRKPSKGYEYVAVDDSCDEDDLGDGEVRKSSKKGTNGGAKSNGAQRLREAAPDDEDEESGEIFPSIGPYQCEICLIITKTKKDFIIHLKRLHRGAVDEDVIRDLENDQKKSKKVATGNKQQKVTAAAAKKKKQELLKKKKAEARRNKRKQMPKKKKQCVGTKSRPGPASARQPRKIAKADSPDSTTPNTNTSGQGDEASGGTEATAKNDATEQVEDGDDSKKSQFWKTNVARKYEQENVMKEEGEDIAPPQDQQQQEKSEDQSKEGDEVKVVPELDDASQVQQSVEDGGQVPVNEEGHENETHTEQRKEATESKPTSESTEQDPITSGADTFTSPTSQIIDRKQEVDTAALQVASQPTDSTSSCHLETFVDNAYSVSSSHLESATETIVVAAEDPSAMEQQQQQMVVVSSDIPSQDMQGQLYY